jgi:hypothetical protein
MYEKRKKICVFPLHPIFLYSVFPLVNCDRAQSSPSRLCHTVAEPRLLRPAAAPHAMQRPSLGRLRTGRALALAE